MEFHRYLIPLGIWASAGFGLLHLLVYVWIEDPVSLALSLALFAMSLALKSYGLARTIPRPITEGQVESTPSS